MSNVTFNPYTIQYPCCIPDKESGNPKVERTADPQLVPSTNILKYLFSGPDKTSIPTITITTLTPEKIQFDGTIFVNSTNIIVDRAVKIETTNYIINTPTRPEYVCFWHNRSVQSFYTACLGGIISVAGALASLPSISVISISTVIVGLGIAILGIKRSSEAAQMVKAWACPALNEQAKRRAIRDRGIEATLNYQNLSKAEFLHIYKQDMKNLCEQFKTSKGTPTERINQVLNAPVLKEEHYSAGSNFVKFGLDASQANQFYMSLKNNKDNIDEFGNELTKVLEWANNLQV